MKKYNTEKVSKIISLVSEIQYLSMYIGSEKRFGDEGKKAADKIAECTVELIELI
jgi:phage-related tail protein